MSTTVIISLVAVVLFVMMAVALTIQSIDKSNKEKKRMLTALKGRARNFEYVLETLPAGFLSPELYMLVCQQNLDTCEQLSQLDSGNAEFKALFDAAYQRHDMAKKQPTAQKAFAFNDSKQIKEVKQLLTMLFNFIISLQKSGKLNAQQAGAFANQVKQLMLQSETDALMGAAKDAAGKGKFKLSIHYHNMVIDKYKKQNASGAYNDKIAILKQQIEELNKHAANEAPSPTASAVDDETAKEWDSVVSADDDNWKKKAIYD